MIYGFFLVFYLSQTDGYQIKGRGLIPISRDDVINFVSEIVESLNDNDDVSRNKALRSGYDLTIDTKIDNITNSLIEENWKDTDNFNHKDNSDQEYPAQDFIDILLKFNYKFISEVWDRRPDIKTLKIDDLRGELHDKNTFIQHLTKSGDNYRAAINKCEAHQFKVFNKTMPNHLIVTDLLNIADKYKVSITSINGKPVDIYSNGRIDDGSFKDEDLGGSEFNKRRFLRWMNDFKSEDFKDAFDRVSNKIYGVYIPDHVKADWIIAAAKVTNVRILSKDGMPFDMYWRRRPDSYVGYPPGSYGGVEHVRKVCLYLKK